MKRFARLFKSSRPTPQRPETQDGVWPFANLAKAVIALEKAEAALRERKWDKADDLLHDVEADPPDRAQYLTLRAMVASGQQNWRDAERRWQAVIDEFPALGDPYGGKADAIRMQGRLEECVFVYLTALRKAPMDLAAPSMLAHMLKMLPEALVIELAPQLAEALDRHLDNKRQRPLVFRAKAQLASAQGDADGAVLALRVAQAAAVNDETIRDELAVAEAGLAAKRAPAGPDT